MVHTLVFKKANQCCLATMATFDVMAWNETHRECSSTVNFDPPVLMAHWTRTSITQGGQYMYGDASGECGEWPFLRQ